MDLELEINPTPTKSDDTEIDYPPNANTQPIKPSSFTNGILKNRHHHPPPSAAYGECRKNHAAALGGHAVDGCCEYMPPPSSPADPTLLKCAACGCHRNFHRREPEHSSATAFAPPFLDFRLPAAQPKRISPSIASPPVAEMPFTPQSLLALSTAAEEHHHEPPATPTGENPGGRKRSRTKFSQEQREKMHSFSEKLGWKMHKSDEAAVEGFCEEVGVAKGVLRVWMHNHKNVFGKKQSTNYINGELMSSAGDNNGGREDGEMRSVDSGNHFQDESGGGVHYHGFNNVSCSSS